MKPISFLLMLALWLSSTAISFAQAPANLKGLDAYIENAMAAYKLPGLSIAVVKDGKVIYQNGFGVKDITTGEKVDENTVFAIASLSKAFTAASVGMLVDEGKLDWDDRVNEHLPTLKLHDDYISSQLTVRDLLCHRSGLRTFDGDLLWYGTDYSRAEILNRIRHLPVQYDFRARFGYQNIMFIAAGELAPQVTSLSWDNFVKKRIFQPLGMTNSYTSISQFPKDVNLAMPHVKGAKDRLLNYDNSGGAAAINSSVVDLSKWMNMWLAKGQVDGKTLLKEGTINTIFRTHTNLGTSSFDAQNQTHFKGYGLGWFLMDYKGVKVVHHGGGLPGYISKLALVPEQNLGIIVLSNGETSLPAALMYTVIDVVNGRSDQDWAKRYLEFAERGEKRNAEALETRNSQRQEGTKASVDSDKLVGSYTDKMYGNANVSINGKQLHLTLEPAKNLFHGDLIHWHHNTYQVKLEDRFLPPGYVTFEFDSNGEVSGLQIDLPNPDFHFYNLHFLKN